MPPVMPPTTNIQFEKRDHSKLAIIILAVALTIAIGAAAWGIWNYIQQKTDVDSRIAAQVATEKKAQADELEAAFAAREKEPNASFAGPDDFGRLSFKYPKTWSVYINKEVTSGGEYQAYLNPVTVPPVDDRTSHFALRVLIETEDYDRVVNSYQQLVKKGDLKSSSVSINGTTGVRLEGAFDKEVSGYAVIFKIRDKAATVRTDSKTFKADFDKLVKTITFNK